MTDVGLTLIVIYSADVERSVCFYRSLGLNLVQEQHGKGPVHYASQIGSTVLEVYACTPESPATSTFRLGFRVPSLESALAVLAKQGVEILSAPKDSPWGRRAVVADPDGHRVEITE
jgi:lactoylglutathione lyase